jgi:hypothetical protein
MVTGRKTARLAAGALALSLAVGCASAEPSEPPPLKNEPPPRHAEDGTGKPPVGVRAGAFSWRDVRGGQDRIEAFCDLRDRTVALLEEAARFPGQGGAESPALRELPAVRATFDETRAPEQLDARVVYFDRERRPPTDRDEVPAEGVEIRLRRLDARGPARTLTVTLEDTANAGMVDGEVDRISIRWSPASLTIDVESDGGALVQRVRKASEAEYRVTSPYLGAILARAQSDVYKPLGGLAFARAVREGSAPLIVRPSPPRNTSFVSSTVEAGDRHDRPAPDAKKP